MISSGFEGYALIKAKLENLWEEIKKEEKEHLWIAKKSYRDNNITDKSIDLLMVVNSFIIDVCDETSIRSHLNKTHEDKTTKIKPLFDYDFDEIETTKIEILK